MKTSLFLLGLPTVALALPGMMGAGTREEIVAMLREKRASEPAQGELEKRQLLPSLTALVNDVKGLLGSVASSVDPDNYRPEPGYDFIVSSAMA